MVSELSNINRKDFWAALVPELAVSDLKRTLVLIARSEALVAASAAPRDGMFIPKLVKHGSCWKNFPSKIALRID